jgi:hypothetical protein
MQLIMSERSNDDNDVSYNQSINCIMQWASFSGSFHCEAASDFDAINFRDFINVAGCTCACCIRKLHLLALKTLCCSSHFVVGTFWRWWNALMTRCASWMNFFYDTKATRVGPRKCLIFIKVDVSDINPSSISDHFCLYVCCWCHIRQKSVSFTIFDWLCQLGESSTRVVHF